MIDDDDEVYANVREFLGWAVGQRILDITQHDEDEFAENEEAYVMVQLDNGGWIRFIVEGFSWSEDGTDEKECEGI